MTLNMASQKLMITEDARRSSATSLKCRCNKAKVLEILDFKDNKLSINKGYSVYDYTFEYEVGKMVSVDNFNEDRWKEMCHRNSFLYIIPRCGRICYLIKKR